MKKSKERKVIIEQVERTLETYCSNCFLYRHHKKEFGRTYAHQFCLSSCTIGEKLRDYGGKLNKVKEK